jgi:hypothetical protein
MHRMMDDFGCGMNRMANDFGRRSNGMSAMVMTMVDRRLCVSGAFIGGHRNGRNRHGKGSNNYSQDRRNS